MKAAAIDMGTNSTRLLVARLDSDKVLDTIVRQAKITRLGEGVDSDLLIKSAAIDRTFNTLAEYKNILLEEGVEKVRVAATSAVRDARNSQDFLGQIKSRFGWNTEILSGKEEAKLSFLGATYSRQSSALSHQPILVIDVGGGSTELIVGSSTPSLLFSLDIGGVRLTEKFIKSDPPLPSEMAELREYVKQVSAEAMDEIGSKSPSLAVGLAGTFTTLSAIKQEMEEYDWSKVHKSTVTVEEIERILNQLASVPLVERQKITGLEPARADVVIAGTLIILEILRVLRFNKVMVSEQDILDGLLLEGISTNKPINTNTYQ